MVKGLDRFREFFTGFESQYAIIGGTACDLLLDAAGLEFRATKDIDMVLCVEVIEPGFANKFKAFIETGRYRVQERGDGKKQFHRFHKPEDASFPYMLELFSRKPQELNLGEDTKFTKIPVEDDVISLSAILLDDNYYHAMQLLKRVEDGVMIVDERMIIPLKAKAFLDLSARWDKGEKIDSKDIKKHQRDVFRLAQLLAEDSHSDVPESIRADLAAFLDLAERDEKLDPKSFGVLLSKAEAIELLRSVYELA
jgi:hypothetical protein